MKRLLAFAALMSCTAAAAADLPKPAAPVAPAELPMWSRFYGGLNVGYGFGANSSVTNNGVSGSFLNTGNNAPIGLAITSTNNNGGYAYQSGVIAGGQIGYNRQITPMFVVGVEADIQGSAIDGSAILGGAGQRSQGGATVSYALSNNVSTSVEWLGTVRGRAGYLVLPTLLVYGTGGLAYGETSLTSIPTRTIATINAVGSFPSNYAAIWSKGSANNVATGWTIGGGAEWMLSPNWSVKAEALYYSLGTQSVNNAEYRLDVNTPYIASAMTTRAGYYGVIARAGVNYHFNWFFN